MIEHHSDTGNFPQTGTEITRSTLALSKHARLRMAQRNISRSDLEYVLAHGVRINRTGVTVYILRSRDILQGDRRISRITRLEGTVVMTGFRHDSMLEVITVYRNKNAFKAIRGKAKYDHRKNRSRGPEV